MKNTKTYANGLESFLAFISKGKKSKSIKNYRAALKSWINAHNLRTDGIIGNEFGDNFENFCRTYSLFEEQRGIQISTISSRLSLIRKIRDFLQEGSNIVNALPATFRESLVYLMKQRDLVASDLVDSLTKVQINEELFISWFAGNQMPQIDDLPLIAELESFFDIPAGTLSAKLKKTYSAKPKAQITSFGKIVQINSKKTYYVWTDQINTEFELMREFHTAIIPPNGMKRLKQVLWTPSEGAERPTADRVLANLKSFTGFLCLPENAADPMLRGMGFRKEQLSLALLTEKHLLEKFLFEFKPARTRGTYNNGYLTFLSTVTSELRDDTGYIFQSPQLADKLEYKLTADEWRAKCRDTRNRMLEIKKAIENAKRSGSGEFEMGRDPCEPIAEILALPQPITVIIKMVKDMLADVELLGESPRKQATLFRDMLLIALLQANPLRMRMFKIMQFDRNLVREKNGSWWIKFKRKDFKNRRSISGDYQMRLAPEVWHLIERYKAEFRPLFPDAATSPYVFLRSTKSKKPESSSCFQNLNTVVAKVTRKYIPGSPGFGGHYFRHIIATSIIKNRPDIGFFLASKVLHDKLETIEENYAHLRTNDFIEPYNRYLSLLWTDSNGSIGDDYGEVYRAAGSGENVHRPRIGGKGI